MTIWHENDDFWEAMAPKLFHQDSWNKAPSEIDNIMSLLKINPKADILDLCCGPGRHSLELARRGFQVTGVDKNLKYLEEARKRAEAEKLNVEFVEEDMRHFCRSETFDVVLRMYSSPCYFEDIEEDEQVLKNIYRSLKKKGNVLIDLMGKEILARIFRKRDWYEKDGILYLEEKTISKGWSWLQSRWIKIQGDERREFTVSTRIYSGTELSSLLLETGFRDMVDWIKRSLNDKKSS